MAPDNASVWGNKGVALQVLTRLPEAVDCYVRALKIEPDNLDFLYRHGVTCLALNDYAKARESFQRLTKLAPVNTLALHGLGMALQGLNMLEAALACFDRACAINPLQSETHFKCGNLLLSMARNEEAVLSYDAAIRVDAKVPEIHNNRGVALRALQRKSESLAAIECALSLRPDYADAHNNRGIALRQMGRLHEALESYDRTLALSPDCVAALNNRGAVLTNLNRIDEALASFADALKISPQHYDAIFNESLCLLLKGEYERGFQQYETRWMQDGVVENAGAHAKPLWLGMSDIKGKTILLHAEQGYGDTIQFCRYAKQIAAMGARVALHVPTSLLPLLEGLAGVDVMSDQIAKLPPADLQCPLLSLPLACKTALADVSGEAYLQAPPSYVDNWTKRLGKRQRLRIGVMWSGSKIHRNDMHRSIPWAQFHQILSPDVDFFSLQNLTRASELPLLDQCKNLYRFDEMLKDFADTAALISLMDLVITVDTAVAHLAGALGKPVWILLPVNRDWRWLLERSDTPWYDSAILFRQAQLGDWDSVLRDVHVRLETQLSNGVLSAPTGAA
jgi:tetratricopeptide (TPR) repeat protein